MSKRRFPFPFSLFHHPPSTLQHPISNLQPPTSIFRLIRRYVPWGVIDALIVAASLLLAWSVRAVTAALDIRPMLLFGLAAIGVSCTVNHYCSLYHRLWRYASAGEIVVIAAAVAASTALLTLVDIFWPGMRPVPISVVPMMGLFAFVGFVSVRYRRRVWTGFQWRWQALRGQFPEACTQVLIVGAGEAGQLLAWRFLNQKEGEGYKLVGFVDDDSDKKGMRLHGLQILGDRHAIPQIVARRQVDLIVIAIYNISGDDFRAILDICEQTPAVIKVLPSIFDFIQGVNGLSPIRDVTAEDLLGRKPVEIDREACRSLLEGKIVLVTGAAGSIGSELCRQIINFGPRQLLMLDNNESDLHDRWVELNGEEQQVPLQLLLGSITNRKKMRGWFETYRPQLVFHAAAYKHVPLMEEHPDESVWVNVAGTLIATELARQSGVERFVLISTDKAVNPCNVMGATKRLCEMMIANQRMSESAGVTDPKLETRNPKPETLFTAVRFGNVLGSRGSVVPMFERQIEQGGPVTVTHPEMTRYFMSLSEAVSLVIQAATLTEGGDIFLLDMGQQIRIDGLAHRLIRLRGLRPGVDISIVYTDPRPGEKMHEELVGEGEIQETTSHPHIFRIRLEEGGGWRIERGALEELIALAGEQRNGELVERLYGLIG